MKRVSVVLLTVAVVATLLLSAIPSGASEHADSPADERWQAFGLGLAIVDQLGLRYPLGVEFLPSEDVTGGFFTDADPNAVAWIESLTFVEAHYRGADPRTRTSSEWTGAEIDSTVTPATQAAAIEAELTLAKLLADPRWAAPGSEAERLGHLLVMEAKAQADYAIVNLRLDDGLYGAVSVDVSGPLTPDAASPLGEQYAMLGALSRLSEVLAGDGPYADSVFRPWFVAAAQQLATRLSDERPITSRDLIDRLASTSAYLSAFPDDQDARPEAEAALTSVASLEPETWWVRAAMAAAVGGAAEDGLDSSGVIDLDAVNRAVLEDLPTRGDNESVDLAQLADLVGALSVMTTPGTGSPLATEARLALDELMSVFFEPGGILPSPRLARPLRSLVPVTFLETIPEPDTTVTTFPLASARLDRATGSWIADPGYVDIAAAFRAGQALIGFAAQLDPGVGRSDESASITREEQTESWTEVAVTSTEFAFQPGRTRVEAGQEFTLTLHNDGVVPHNIEIPELGILVESLAGSSNSISAVAPNTPGSYRFICSIPGHVESGMVGELVVVAAPQEAQPITDPSIRMPEVDNLTPAVVMAGGLALAMTAFVIGLIRFIRTAEDG